MSKKNEIQDLDQIISQKDFMKSVLTRDAGIVRISNSMPQQDEMKFYMNNEHLKAKQRAINAKILSQLRKIAQFSMYEDFAKLVDLNNFSHIIGINDQLFENVDTTLDRLKKINTGTEASNLFGVTALSQQSQSAAASGDPNEIVTLIAMATKEKPQNRFSDFIDHDCNYPFIPKITEKHHQQLPLDETIQQAQKEGSKFFQGIQNVQTYEFPHPYAFEIESLVFTESQLSIEKVVVQEPISLKEDVIFIETEEALDKMIESLEQASEIAIDVEHHGLRSFQGITCLIQVSDRKKDYIIDVFSVWQFLHRFNIITSNPKIVKVLHGADMDVQWLQRDFAIYIVNLFDTGQAARTLSMPNYSLAYLLSSISKVQTDKKYQLADWRIRPIPKEMLSYARSDTHYLLSIYDVLRNQLIDRAVRSGAPPTQYIETVLNKSKMICLKKHVKPILQDEKYHTILTNQRIILSDRKFRLLKKLLSWRFTQASLFDESPVFVLPNDTMFQIVSRLPNTIKELTSVFLKLSYVATAKAEEIIGLINSEVESNQNTSVAARTNASVEKASLLTSKEDHSIDIEEQKEEAIIFRESIIIPDEDEVKFNLETYEIDLEVFQTKSNFLESHYYANKTQKLSYTSQEKLMKIQTSFVYEDPVEFYCEKFPFLRQAYELAKQQEQEIIKKRLDLAYSLDNRTNATNNEEVVETDPSKDEYLAFQKEKGPSSKPKEVAQIDVPDLPLSYEDQFKTNLKKRKYNFGGSEDNYEPVPGKKPVIGQKSTFDMLIEQEFRASSSDDDDDHDNNKDKQNKKGGKSKTLKPEDKQQMQDDFNTLTSKIQNQMNKDPRFRSGINGKQVNKSNHFNKGATGNKFISKFKKSGF